MKYVQFNAGEKLQQAVKAGQSDDLRVRLSTAVNPSDARAIDVKISSSMLCEECRQGINAKHKLL